ncbi:MAG: SpoIID/LytB domain-containing protein [bacterium]|nr:SpoIID/LytB domain-containing protein [bacterium]
MSLEVHIGLLWDEPAIRGEFAGEFLVRCRVDCCRFLTLDETAGAFEAFSEPGRRQHDYAIRLCESLSPAHAERTLSEPKELAQKFDVDIVEAGRTWESGGQQFDIRVWWPIVKLDSLSDAEKTLDELRAMPGLDPLGLALVRLDRAVPDLPFEFRFGSFSGRALEIWTTPLSPESFFRLHDVPIGRGFHWQRKESLDYRGSLRLFHPGGAGLSAVNRLELESYLESAVGSEMRSDLPAAFSQAQAIAARSTVLATANRHHFADGFDLCHDDHCQCYQGILREADAVVAPIRESSGIILVSPLSTPLNPPTKWRETGAHSRAALPNDASSFIVHRSSLPRVVDARYAKSCGGVSERYEAAWGGEGPDYFTVRACGEFSVPDLSREDSAREFLKSDSPAWCNPRLHPYPDPWDKDPLFRWTFEYTRKELGDLIAEKTGHDVGRVQELNAIRRGKSGRILILEIVGEAGTQHIYGELNIRRALSKSHLPSSFFVVDERADRIILSGGGWGHGVGLCQLGAAAMARAGWNVESILNHYYPRTELMNL